MLLLPSVGMADIMVITFDDLNNMEVVSDQYSALGVEFSAEYFSPFPDDIYPQYWASSGGIEFGPSYCNSAAYFQADFSVPVDYVAVELEPFEVWDGLTYYFGMEIYDSADNIIDDLVFSQLIEQAGLTIPLEASSSSPNIAYARFYGYWGPTSGVNSVIADNFTYNAVPEPSTILLMGLGLVGLAGFGRRKFKK
jgi:hypothetical protein